MMQGVGVGRSDTMLCCEGWGVGGAVTQCCDAREGGGGGWGSDAVL